MADLRPVIAMPTAVVWAIALSGCLPGEDPADASTPLDGSVDAAVNLDAAAVTDTLSSDLSVTDISQTPDASVAADGSGGVDPSAPCPALPAPDPTTENIIHVNSTQIDQLQGLVSGAVTGDTILFADGHYELNGVYLWVSNPGVTLRSASGDRDAVILDGNLQTTEIVTIAASNVTLADLTLREAFTHPIHVVATAESDTLNTRIYNVHIVDPREQAIKINTNDVTHFADQGTVACSHLELTDVGRPSVNPTSGGCYTGGVDAHRARDWVIRDNVIEGFWCETGLAEHAVHFWRGGRDTLVERNEMRNNARGVGFGLSTSGDARTFTDHPCSGVSGYVGHYGGRVRNNFIHVNSAPLLASASGFDCGICLWSSCGTEVVHNTVVSTGANFSSIEWRFETSTGIEVRNNLVSHTLRQRDPASASLGGNLENAPLSLFENGSSGDLHLISAASAAIDQGEPLAAGLCDRDIDGEPRDSSPDIGADERS